MVIKKPVLTGQEYEKSIPGKIIKTSLEYFLKQRLLLKMHKIKYLDHTITYTYLKQYV